MSSWASHITVCLCTYKRPSLLMRALDGVCVLDVNRSFTYSIVVVDNDHQRSAEAVVQNTGARTHIPITYCVEPRQNIALARNKALATATGELLAFLDDDECPPRDWLVTMLDTLERFGAHGVLGPVKPSFDAHAPRWVIEGGFYDRPDHPTGMTLAWGQCRTGNVLLRRAVVSTDGPQFRPEFLSGEDQDFFRRKIAQGWSFVWCNEAPVYEAVPANRWSPRFLVRRALFRGVFSHKNRSGSAMPIVESLVAMPAYVVVLPVALFIGRARFMKCVFTLSYHAGRLLAAIGINPIRQPYVVD